MIGIEGFAVGHGFAAQFFSVETGDAGCGNLVTRWKVLFSLIGNDAAWIALASGKEEAGERDPHCGSDSL